MNHEEVADLLGAYALDAVDDDERLLVEDHLRGCARCRAEVQDHREVATLLAYDGAAAPEGVWQRITEALEQAPPGLRLMPVSSLDDEPATLRRRVHPKVPRLVAATVAAALLVLAVLGIEIRRQDQRIDELQVALEDPLVPAFQAAVEAPSSRLVELRSADGAVVVHGAMTDDGTGYLQARGLPRLDADRTYQLWGTAGSQVVSLGVLGAEPSIVTFPADDYDALAITVEARPGVVTSRNQPLVSSSTA